MRSTIWKIVAIGSATLLIAVGIFLLLTISSQKQKAPSLTRVDPLLLDPADVPLSGALVTLHGDGFRQGSTLQFSATSIEQLTVISSTTISAIIPRDVLVPGWYDLLLMSPNGEYTRLRSGLGVLDRDGSVPKKYYTIQRSRGGFLYATEGNVGQRLSTYQSSSPHYAHMNVLDWGNFTYYSNNPPNYDRDTALRWTAQHVDITRVGMTSFTYFNSGNQGYYLNAARLKAINPTMKTFGYELDLSMCLHQTCSAFNKDGNGNATDNVLNNNQNNLPESYYLHFAKTTKLEYYDVNHHHGYIDWNGNNIQDTGEPVMPDKTIPGCADPQNPDPSCRVITFGWTDYRYLSNMHNSNANNILGKTWPQWYSDHLLNETDQTFNGGNPLDGVFLDEHGPGFNIPIAWGYQVKVAAGQAIDAGTILEYGLRPKDTTSGNFDAMDNAYNADMVSWLQYLSGRFAGVNKFLLPNLGYTDALTAQQFSAANGATTELEHQPDAYTSGADEYQQLITITSTLAAQSGAHVDLYGNPCQYLPSTNGVSFVPGNYATSKDRWWMWRLASYYLLKEPVGSLGKMYFNPNLCYDAANPTLYLQEWLPAYELDLGVPTESIATTYQQGTIGQGACGSRAYRVFGRHYNQGGTSSALMLVRPRDDASCTNYGDASAVNVALDADYHLLKSDGTEAATINNRTISLRNAEAAVLVRNRAPVFDAIPGQLGLENQPLTFDITGSDADNDTIAFSSGSLPAGATLTVSGTNRATFSWTPSYTQAGTYTVNILASDGVASTTYPVTITITNVNRAPTLSPIGNKTVLADATLSFTTTGSDPDGDVLTYSVTNLPSGATFTNNVFSWTPSNAQAGDYPGVRFQVSDGNIAVAESITITVQSTLPPPDNNHAPVFGTVPAQTVDEGVQLRVTVVATDQDGDALTMTAQNVPYGAMFTDAGQGNGQVLWTPTLDQAGAYTMTVTAADSKTSTSATLSITVRNVNRQPILTTLADTTVTAGTTLAFTVTGSDPDGDALSYSATGLPIGAIFTGNVFSWVPTEQQVGATTITFHVTDGIVTVSGTMLVTVVSAQGTTTQPGSDTAPPPTEPTNTQSAPSTQNTPTFPASGGSFVSSKSFPAFPTKLQTGFTVATGNVWGDVREEIVTGTGNGVGSQVRVFSNDGKLRGQFYAYPRTLNVGVRVAVCDLNGDGRDEIVTAPGRGFIPQVRIFDFSGKPVLAKHMWVLDGKYKGGVNIACADVDHDGKADVIASASAGSAPQITVHRPDGRRIGNFFPYPRSFRGGVTVAAGDLTGDGRAEIITGTEIGPADVRFFTSRGVSVQRHLLPFAANFRGGVSVAVGDTNGDHQPELVVTPFSQTQALVKVYDRRGITLYGKFLAYPSTLTSGIRVAAGDVDGDGVDDVVTIPGAKASANVRILQQNGTLN